MEVPLSEAASRLGVSVDTVRRRLRTGGLAGRQVGRRTLVSLPESHAAPQRRASDELLAEIRSERNRLATQVDSLLRQLEAASAAWARRLAGLGVRRGALVGVCFERTPEMVIALLAVLRAGAAYVPMDPTLPVARLRFLAADANCPVVLPRSACAPDPAGPCRNDSTAPCTRMPSTRAATACHAPNPASRIR